MEPYHTFSSHQGCLSLLPWISFFCRHGRRPAFFVLFWFVFLLWTKFLLFILFSFTFTFKANPGKKTLNHGISSVCLHKKNYITEILPILSSTCVNVIFFLPSPCVFPSGEGILSLTWRWQCLFCSFFFWETTILPRHWLDYFKNLFKVKLLIRKTYCTRLLHCYRSCRVSVRGPQYSPSNPLNPLPLSATLD